jgi:adenylate kinase family enzyme
MKPQSFIFIGRSGSGKGTQAALLMDALKKIDPKRDSIYIQTGDELRKFIKGESYAERATKDLYDAGGLMPEFIMVYQWVRVLIDKYTGTEHFVLDGTPRKPIEAAMLDSVFTFFKREKPWVINIEVKPDASLKRLLVRKRFDDVEEEIRRRLAWYETDVAPTVDYYRNNPNYNFLTIDGERSVEAIHADIVKKLGLE